MQTRHLQKLSLALLTTLTIGQPGASAAPAEAVPTQALLEQEVVIDAVVASVDDKPITLSELNERFIPPRKLSFREAAKDPDAQKALDALILEKLIQEEAQAKRITASDSEVEEYINEVARRNNLPRPDFERELVAEGGNLDAYKRQVRFDILRTKLVSTLARGGVTVSEGEIDEYIEAHPELNREGTSYKLRQLLIGNAERSPDEVQQRLEAAVTALESGTDFAQVARQYSDGPQAQEGGSIGIVAASDLSQEVLDAISKLGQGERSEPIATSLGIQIFLVEQRFDKEEDDDDSHTAALREEVRKSLTQQKSQDKLSSFFVTELYKNHAVDKKL